MGDGDKICTVCGKSCAGQARIKNDKGQYAHRACIKAKQEQISTPKPAPASNGGAYDLLEGITDDNMLGSSNSCPGCGVPMDDESIVCMTCGFNRNSGQRVGTKSSESRATSGAGASALGGAAAVGGLAAGPTLAFVGAVIGGVLGATIWGAIAYFTGYEIGYVAIGVGVLVGIGAQLGGGSETTGGGMVVGVMAAIVAVASIAGGKYSASYMFVQDNFAGSSFVDGFVLSDIDDQWVLSGLVDEVCQERIDNGETIEWDNPMLFVESAMWPDDYPTSTQDEVNAKWESLNDAERVAFRKGVAERVESDFSYRDIDEEWALTAMADMVLEARIENGETINWPNPNLAMQGAEWPDDYPELIQTQTIERWEAMSADEQIAHRTQIMDSMNGIRKSVTDSFTQDSFIQSFMHPLDLLFLALAMGAAYKIGYGE